MNGLKEDAREAAKNLEDVIETNDALLLENTRLKEKISGFEHALNEKDEQTLLKKHNDLVQENEETIESLIKAHEHCQC